MEMIIVIALLIVISVDLGIKLRMEYENIDRLECILQRLKEMEKPESETFTDKQKEDILCRILFSGNLQKVLRESNSLK